ncbi:uncharacterized protein LOC129595507 [Paramacrobiotus metropolitanus]|uniref:uncharacterized protein LOC129595507 n=1 Tax=Paramacrobiotus metropolitanus TaxID=2943436 RepID=UPI002445A51A|nr:uncharacterized protein LOC129595507 [Paramacrobiotus metropolitanus]XP_055348519.1 uncharacterized protein LOC129595507 [Paramacrobiotus metropolitanus]XP_055348520.1 uncharacterized protein LOC129595507 [Paramacrobiotus metropolitanus]XP_055348521.1 uncharacterized protein LOC129595507 [Paramacrobiotus metropolitanus]
MTGVALKRTLTWAYHDILLEALVVFWIGCHISLKFGTRFFPEWEVTRVDPDSYTELDSLLWLMLGREMNGCTWDDIVLAWKPGSASTVIDPAATYITRPTQVNFGYYSAIATVISTAVLGVSVTLSILVNRHWGMPRIRWTEHIRNCGRITSFMGYNVHFDGECNPWKDPATPMWIFVIKQVVVAVCAAVCFPALWIFLCVLPLIEVAGLTVLIFGRICGHDAVFPTCVVVFCLLAAHCTGRVWGVWMQDSYFTRLREYIRRLTGLELIVQLQPTSGKSSTKTAAGDSSRSARWELLVAISLFVVCGCTCAVHNSINLFFRARAPVVVRELSVDAASEARNRGYWLYVNCTDCCHNYATGMNQITAMLSYWMDLRYPRLPSDSNPALVSLFSSKFSPVTEFLYIVWMGVILFLAALPFISVAVAEIIMICKMLIGYLESLFRVGTNRNQQHLEDIDDSWNARDNDRASTAGTVKKNGPPAVSERFCICALGCEFLGSSALTLQRILFCKYLPLTVVAFALPEHLQLPGVLLLLTALIVGVWYKLLVGIFKVFREEFWGGCTCACTTGKCSQKERKTN